MWLQRFSKDDGIYTISSPRSFDGGEEAYDAIIGQIDESRLVWGCGAAQLIQHAALRDVSRILEIGAGTGIVSVGLVKALPRARDIVITDTSAAFLRIVRQNLSDQGISLHNVRFATLSGEDLARVPNRSVDAIVIASALHHISDWRGFIREAARALLPGGVLAIQEPMAEGNLYMAAIAECALAMGSLPPDDAQKIRCIRDSIVFLTDTTIEKLHGEDKHCFLIDDLVEAAAEAGFARSTFYGNVHFCDFVDRAPEENLHRPSSLLFYFVNFLRNHHNVSEAGIASISTHVFPLFQSIERAYARGDGPALHVVATFRR
jgi:ubiquinone/menaquinone biosynthesis C-methylase UbiE